VTTSITAASIPTSTQVFTSVVTQTPNQGTSLPPTTVVVTSSATSNPNQQTGLSTSSTSTGALSPTKQASHSSGLSPAGKTAIAVIIPIAVVAALIFAGILLWRRRNRRLDDAEERRKEMEAYQYNPNNDPTLPAVGVKDDDNAGYRGWRNTGAVGVGRKTSTNASSGVPQYSDPGTLVQPVSPTHGAYATDAQGNTVGHHRNGTMDSDTMGNLGPMAAGAATAGAAGAAAGAAGGALHRGVSNASSTYSNGAPSNHSNNDYPIPYNPNNQEYIPENMYSQSGPYDGYNNGGQPVMRESPARRLTQVQDPNVNPQHGGIARNF
jgi:nitrogen fixation-related uncharacterized protein